jgi:peroxisomal 2,4-dienoyl-CoA reductase
MPLHKSEYISDIWKDGIFGTPLSSLFCLSSNPLTLFPANKVVFCTGGAGTICSAQVRALVHLGANACIIGRNVEKTETVAKDIATSRPGAKVIGIGAVDVRKFDDLKAAVERCVKELGAIDYVM